MSAEGIGRTRGSGGSIRSRDVRQARDVRPARLVPAARRWWGEAVVSRYLVVRTMPAAGGPVVAGLLVVQVLLGLLPVGFILASSVLVGRVPAAVGAGVGSPPGTAWCARSCWRRRALSASSYCCPRSTGWAR